VNPPPEPQLLPDEPEEELPKHATAEIFLCVSMLPQTGQAGSRSASEKRTIFSKSSLQLLHWYSYNGIFHYLYDQDTIPQYSIYFRSVKGSQYLVRLKCAFKKSDLLINMGGKFYDE